MFVVTLRKGILAGLLFLQASTLSVPADVPVITAEERCLAWATWDEARGEPRVVQRAVLDVILFRMKNKGQSACSVVKAPHQFSGYRKGVIKNVSDKALRNFFIISRMQRVVKASHFHSGKKPYWAYKFTRVAVIGRLSFYRES